MSFLVRASLTAMITLGLCAAAYTMQLAPAELSNTFAGADPNWAGTDDIWTFQDGHLVGKTTEAATWDRYYGSQFYAGGEFEVSVDIKYDQVGDWGGGGIIFNSGRSTGRNPSMMTRILANRAVIAGYFSPRGDYSEHKAVEFDEKLTEGWHTLKAHVKGNDGTFDVFVDGKKLLVDIPLNYDRGYFGLTICDGTVGYRNFSFKQLKPAEPRKTYKSGTCFGFSTKKELIASDPLTSSMLFYDRKGDLQRTIKVAQGVQAFAVNGATIAAISPMKPLAQFYKENGDHIDDLELQNADAKPIADITSLYLDDNRFLYILSAPEKTIYRLKGKSAPMQLSVETVEPEAALVDFDVQGNMIYVIDDKAYVYSYKLGNLREMPQLVNTFRASGGGEVFAIAANDRNIYTVERDNVVRYSTSGVKRSVFRGYKLRGFSPVDIHTAPKRMVQVLDRANDTIVILDEYIAETFPRVDSSPATAEISWTTAGPKVATVKLFKDGKLLKSVLDRRISRKHTAKFDGLTPGTRYEYVVEPEETSFPETLKERKQPFVTSAGRGMTQYMDYPIAVFLFTNVIDDSLQKPEWPDTMKPIPESEIQRFKDEIRHTCRFYFVNSHFKYNVKPDFIVVTDKFKRSEVFGEGSSYPPRKELIMKILADRKKDPAAYNACLYVPATQAYSEKTGKYYIRGYGGGFTAGTNGTDPGICWWDMTMKDHGAGNDWLMLHEFDHQTDSLMAASGHPEYWFNHYAMLDDNVGKFYWWYDADGYLIRETTPASWWLDCRFSTIHHTPDKDGDGIPDDDPNLWLDEKRLGSSPEKKDTDGDGLSDFDEVFSWNNSDRGWGEDYGGRRIHPDPANPDSDGDGLKDGVDPQPMYTNSFEIKKATHDVDKPFQRDAWTKLYTLSDPRIAYSVFINWDENNLYVAIEAPEGSMRSIALDATTDGWFTGSDNYRFQWGYRGREFQYELYNCSDPTKFGFNDKPLVENDYKYRFEEHDGLSVLLFSLARNEKTGLTLQPGDKLSFQALAGPAPNPYGWSRYISYFEPNKLMDFTLVGD